MLVLVWPDPGQSNEDVEALLTDIAGDVLITGWDPTSDDGGRTVLLTSVRDARSEISANGGDPDELTLIGFGLGAVAAAGLTRYAKRLGIDLGRVIAVAGTWDEPDPFSGSVLAEIPERVELVPDAEGLTCRRPR